jgi:23S rRNA (cytidine2498-2'-O)-methyltransferase
MSRGVLVAYCRAGFEAEAAADLRRVAVQANLAVDIVAAPASGFVVATADRFDSCERALAAAPPIFARSVFAGSGPYPLLAAKSGQLRADRVTPLLAAIAADGAAPPWRSAWLEYPDTNEGKALSPLARAVAARVDGELRARGDFDNGAARRLHVFLPDGGQRLRRPARPSSSPRRS